MGLLDGGCKCGCSSDDHDYPGGACLNHWHCDYYEEDGPAPDPADATTPGERQYIEENYRPGRFW
jgi:hypothetical protein